MLLKKTFDKFFQIQFFRYCFSGGISAITDLILFFILNELIGIHYLIALTISFVIAVTVNYIMQRKITFRSEYKKKHKQFTIFLSVQIIGLAFNGILMYWLVELLTFWPTLAKLLAIFIVLIYTYSTNTKLTFNLK